MQLRFSTTWAFKTTGYGFKNSASALLSTITLGGVFSAVIFNSETVNSKVNQALESVVGALTNSYLYDGAKHIGNTLKGWGQAIVTSKDDFKEWLSKYLGPDGFKSGVVNLYEKLRDWVELVYTWFKDRFLEFVGNIPKMVENWRKLRLSLFKWGTFLGGGGGAALWSMFGGFDNLGQLAELMGNEDFRSAAEKFAELVDQNPKAFEDMGEENMKEILGRIAEEPNDAKEIIQELLDKQKKIAEEAKKEKPEEQEPQLEQKQITDAFKQAKGSPQSEEQVIAQLTEKVLKGLSDLSEQSSFFGEPDSKKKAKEEIEKYIKEIETKKDQKTKSGEAFKSVWEVLSEESNKETLINGLSELSSRAFLKAKEKGKNNNIAYLKKELKEVMESDLTVEVLEGEEAENIVDFKKIINIMEKD